MKGLAHSSPLARSSVPTEPAPISNARLAADLQALTLALHIGGLDGLRSGAVKIGGKP